MKKQWISLVLLVVLVFSICLPAQANTTMYVYTANGKSLNMRSAPITNANNKIANIPYGAAVSVEKTVDNKQWSYVSYDGHTGYVMTRYLVSGNPGPNPQTTTTTTTTSTTASATMSFSSFSQCDYFATVRPSTPSGFVHMRWAPSKQQAIYCDYYAGATLEVIAQDATWAQVRDPETGAVGFMMREFLAE